MSEQRRFLNREDPTLPVWSAVPGFAAVAAVGWMGWKTNLDR